MEQTEIFKAHSVKDFRRVVYQSFIIRDEWMVVFHTWLDCEVDEA